MTTYIVKRTQSPLKSLCSTASVRLSDFLLMVLWICRKHKDHTQQSDSVETGN